MKSLMKTLALAVSATALTAASPALAHEDHACVDDACTLMALFDVDQAQGAAPAAGDPTAVRRMGPWGMDVAGMDRSVKPGDDFDAFVNGTWKKTNTIPADRSSFGGFAVLRDASEARVRKLVEGYKVDDADADRRKLAILYRDFMNEAAIEKADYAPIKPRLAAIQAIKSKKQMAADYGRSAFGLGGSLFGAGVNDDSKNPKYYALYMGQSGLGLPDRDYYLQAQHAEKKAKYQEYVAQQLDRVGWPDAAKAAADVVALETRIAEAHWTRAESRNRDKTYNLMTVADLETQAPGFDWRGFLNAAELTKADKAIVAQNTAFPKIARIFAETDLETLKAQQAFRVVDGASPLLSRRFVEAQFAFRGKYLSGTPQLRERWKRAVGVAEGSLGEAVGRDYVALYFPADSKAKMETLVANLRAALKTRIDGLTWMSPETKTKAQEKLSKFTVKIGYPGKWRDYSTLQIVPGDVVGNSQRVAKFNWDRNAKRLGGEVDRTEWGMTPQTVNAYYSPPRNEIVFPAAILQPPFFDPEADPAVNYGGIGGVIGHEISHGFDDQGRKSDGDGVLRDWWTAEDAAKFEVQAAKLGAQYESYSFPNITTRINGRLTMGENIGDLGGISLGYDAYKVSLNGQPSPVIDGFTGEQRVFLGWGQVWRTLFRDQALQQQLLTDPHSPGQIRAFAPLRNVDPWYDAFGVKEGDKLYVKPEDRVRIW